jgi:hypothetical protein
MSSNFLSRHVSKRSTVLHLSGKGCDDAVRFPGHQRVPQKSIPVKVTTMRSRILLCLYAFATIAAATLQAKSQAPTSLNSAVFDKQYKVQLSFQVTGAYPFTFSIVGGALPACLNLSPDGVLYGMPADTCRGTYTFTVAATDYNGSQTTQSYVLHVSDDSTVVAQAPVAPTPAPQPLATAAPQTLATPAPQPPVTAAPQPLAMPAAQAQAAPAGQPQGTPASQLAGVNQQDAQPATVNVQNVNPSPNMPANQPVASNAATTAGGNNQAAQTTPAAAPQAQTNSPW